MANLNRGLIVSCQAVKGEPLYGLGIMGYFARAAVAGGAVGIRANYVNDINDIKKEVSVPVIGIIKANYEGSDVYITPTLKEVKDLLTTGCEVIALDCTKRQRPNGEKLEDIVDYIRQNAPDVEIMADCSDFEEAQRAHELGFDYIGSTMRGYTPYTKGIEVPDIDFLTRLVQSFPDTKIIAEGGIWEKSQLEKVCDCGVYAVVIGSSITRPKDITERFVGAMKLC
ncbi:MAG: N-acetylmannosamine-6-phosphate 2-epimerase [Clostridia bacterium]|nr:N-acetylmannosamine-6-phosphate 2-epimerase [Clostridia bacterium]MDE7215675.1 N-acetylmannosamine-6-phosphate 2-epimerase [Clostridia bacterium]MDE7337400.1 N-acetylmannosamine-6-phosphate 2-epimerase [Clostridia bacterium]